VSDDFRLQHSIKTTAGDMLNVRGATPQEFEAALQYAENNIERIVNLGALARAVGNAGDAGLTSPTPQAAPAQQAPQASNGWGAQSAPPAAVNGPAPTCRHGAKKWVPAGSNPAKGTKWDGFWGCNGPRGDQCKRGE